METNIMQNIKLWSAEFTLAIGCGLNCRYCPQGKLIHRYTEMFPREDKVMTFDTFKKILRKIEPGAGIAIGGMVEPFQNKECARMIRYAYEHGYKIHLDTTLQGATIEDWELLDDVEFNGIQLHLPDTESNSHFVITKEWMDVFHKVNARCDVSGYHCHGTVQENVVSELYESRPFSNGLMNRAGNLEFEELECFHHEGEIICQSGAIGLLGGWVPEILPNGTVILCCMDYGMEHILGNILKEDWSHITHAEEYLKIENGMDDDSIDILCRRCPAARIRNISRYREEINLRGPNMIRVMRNLSSGGGHSRREKELLQRLRNADNICVFGLGNLFSDNYFSSGWYNVIKANIFSDNNQMKWNTYINGIKCIPPNELKNIENLLVITYVKNDEMIVKQLNEFGIDNIINIYEIFNARDISD